MPCYLSRLAQVGKSLLALSLCALTACTGIAVDKNNPRYAQLARSYEIKGLPHHPQINDQCGPASLATMLGAQGINASPEQLRDKIYIPGKEGAVTTEMVARARRYGLLVYPLKPDLNDVLTEINAGNPVLIMQNLAFDWLPRWHFSVAMGYDLNQQTISLRSGDKLKHEVSFDLFVKTWRRANSWAVVIKQPQQLPATASATELIQAANHLEQVGEVQAALAAYQAVLNAWPQQTLANFAAGNAAYAQGNYAQAQQYYAAYLQAQPLATQGWNNLAYTLQKLNCPAQAKQAIDCALAIKPTDNNLQASLKEIQSHSAAAIKVEAKTLSQCQLSPCPQPSRAANSLSAIP